MPGPVPKRASERRRTNKENRPQSVKVAASRVAVPAGDPDWHPIARDWYASLAVSGQSVFYEPSDWQTARFVAESMHRNLSAARFSAQQFAATMAAMTELLTTEGARRRARVELEREQGEAVLPASVVAMDAYRDALGGA